MKDQGFTLLEILIALFIFSILSMMLLGALHSTMSAQSEVEKSAARLRMMQMALLVLSRDVEQTVNRPVRLASGKEEAAFMGTSRGFTLTHAGFSNPEGTLLHSSMERTRYEVHDQALWRMTSAALDAAPQTTFVSRRLLNEVEAIRFQYLDKENHFHEVWPLLGASQQVLPRAVKVTITISQWGNLDQLYVIAVQPSQTSPQSPPPTS